MKIKNVKFIPETKLRTKDGKDVIGITWKHMDKMILYEIYDKEKSKEVLKDLKSTAKKLKYKVVDALTIKKQIENREG